MPTRTVRVPRKIYFYRMDAGPDDQGRPTNVDLTTALTQIDSLSFAGRDRYLVDDDESMTCMWVDSATPRQKLRLGKVRMSGLPPVEEHGALSELPIPDEAGLVEQIHIVFFPNNIIGSESNFYGPRVSRLVSYLQNKVEGTYPPFRIQPLLRHDATILFNRMHRIRLFQLRIKASFLDTLSRADESLGEAFKAAQGIGESQEVEILLRPEGNKRAWLHNRIREKIRRVFQIPDLTEGAKKFEIKGLDTETERIEPIDFLSSYIVQTKRIMRSTSRTRALSPEATYAAIEESYNEMLEEIERAASIAQ